jgi:hypothetical protein
VPVDRVEQLGAAGGQRPRVRGAPGEDQHLAGRQRVVRGAGRLGAQPQGQPPRLDLRRVGRAVRVRVDEPALHQVDRGRVAEAGRERLDDVVAGQPQVECGADGVGRG